MSAKGSQIIAPRKENSLPTPKGKAATPFSFKGTSDNDESSLRQSITALQADLDRRQADYIKKERYLFISVVFCQN